MKRILSIVLFVAMLSCVFCIGTTSVSATQTATITPDGSTPVKVNVGDVIVYTCYLNAGEKYKVASIQASTDFDSEHLKLLVDYTPDPDYPEDLLYEEQIFPIAYKAGLICNVGLESSVEFNFASAVNGAWFKSDSSVLITAKFEVIAAGDTTIDTNIDFMEQNIIQKDSDGNNIPVPVKVISEGQLTDEKNFPVKKVGKIQTGTTYIVGDVDKSGKLDITDATYIQMKRAKYNPEPFADYAKDCDSNGLFDVTDATCIQMVISKINVAKNVRAGRKDVLLDN